MHSCFFFFKQKTAYEIGLGIPAEPLFRSLGFHKQMDNRIKLLEEILSFRMQGVELDNGDMYVDGHKAASDVRDRSEERRVGKECRSRWSPYHEKKKKRVIGCVIW